MILLAILLLAAVVALGCVLIFKSEEVKTLKCVQTAHQANLNRVLDERDAAEEKVLTLESALEAERKVVSETKKIADLYMAKFEDAVQRHNDLVDAQTLNTPSPEKVETEPVLVVVDKAPRKPAKKKAGKKKK